MPDNILRATIQVTAPGVKETFAQVANSTKAAEGNLNQLGTTVGKTEAVIRQMPPVVSEVSLTLKDQRVILAALQRQYAALSTEQAKSRIGRELAADIKIANTEIKRLEAGAVSSFGNIGQSATKGFSAIRQLAFILPGLGIAGIFNLAFTAIESVVSSLFNVNRGFKEGEIAAALFRQALDDISDSAQKLKDRLDFQDDIAKLRASVAGLKGADLDILDLGNRTKSAVEFITAEQTITSGLERQKKELIEVARAYIQAGAGSERFKQLALLAASGQVVPKGLVSQLEGAEKNIAESFLAIQKEIVDSAKRSADAQSTIGENFLKIQDEQRKKQEELLKKRLSDNNQFVNETIARGKQLAAFFEGRRVVPFFSIFDTKPEQFEKAKKLIEDFNTGALKIILRPPVEIQPEFSIETGFIQKVLVPRFRRLLVEFQSTLDSLSKVDLKLNLNVKLSAKVVGDREAQEKVAKNFEQFAASINESIRDIKIDSLANVGEAIGQALSGGDLKDVFSNFANIIGDGLQDIGKQMIRIGVVASLAKKALAKLFTNPALAVAAGVLLIAAGAALKNLLGGGIKGFAKGGRYPVGKDILVGEKGPEIVKFDRPGTIIPNNKIGQSMASGVAVMASNAVSKTTDKERVVIRDISKEIAQVLQVLAYTIVKQSDSVLRSVVERSQIKQTEKVDSNQVSSVKDTSVYQSIARISDNAKQISSAVERITKDYYTSVSTNKISSVLASVISVSREKEKTKEVAKNSNSVFAYENAYTNFSDTARLIKESFKADSTHKESGYEKSISSGFEKLTKEVTSDSKQFSHQSVNTQSAFQSLVTIATSSIKELFSSFSDRSLIQKDSTKESFTSQIVNTFSSVLERIIDKLKPQPIPAIANNITKILTAASTLNNLTFRAKGGAVSGPTIVGEKGPEFFIPSVSGTIIPHHKLASFTKSMKEVSTFNKFYHTDKEINIFKSSKAFKELSALKVFKSMDLTKMSHKELKKIFGSTFDGGRAGGGFIRGGNLVLVGERGREAFIPNIGQSITNNNNTVGSISGAFSGGGNHKVVFEIAGQTLVGVLTLGQQQLRRLS